MAKKILEVVEILRRLLARAETGEVNGVFVVYQSSNGAYGSELNADDPEDMLHQSRTEQIYHAQKYQAPDDKQEIH